MRLDTCQRIKAGRVGCLIRRPRIHRSPTPVTLTKEGSHFNLFQHKTLAQSTNNQYLNGTIQTAMTSELLSKLPLSINTVYDAEAMLLALTTTNKFYHLDDRPEDIGIFSQEECEALNRLIEEADIVTRKHFGMEERPECLVGLWEGVIKDLLPVGYLAFSADTEPKSIYVYNDSKVIQTTWSRWLDMKTKAYEEDGDSDSCSINDEWFLHQSRNM